MISRRVRHAWAATAFAFVALAATALAQMHPGGGHGGAPPMMPHPPSLPTMAPPKAPTPMPIANPYVKGVADGTRVPLSKLPPLPRQTYANTVSPKKLRHHFRPMAADGSTIVISAGQCGSSGAVGDQFPVGCILSWVSGGLTSGDTKQDYFVASTNANGTHSGATACGSPYTGTAGATHSSGACSTLSPSGTYILGVYDTTGTGKWLTVVYVNAGDLFSIGVYQDPFHTTESYQFDASTSGAAYIYLPTVSQTDFYVVYIEYTSVNPHCIFQAPSGTLTANDLCDFNANAGVQAQQSGNLSVTWALSSSYPAGEYMIGAYDVTTGKRLGQVQVSLTGSFGTVLQTKPDGSGSNINSDPFGSPVPSPTAGTVVAWDGTSDQSTTGITATVTGLNNGSNYKWTMSDPQGQVMQSATGTIASTTGSHTFNFASPTPLLGSGRYAAKTYTMQMYDTTAKGVDASQSFQVLGYSTATYFVSGGVKSTALTVPSSNSSGASANIEIVNTSDGIFGSLYGDNLTKLAISTGNDFKLSSSTGNGIMANTAANVGAGCASCSTTGTDSNGNIWNVTITCPAGALAGHNAECNIVFTPQSSSVSLAPGSSVTVNNIVFYNETSSNCGNPCEAPTVELPQHGLEWSCFTIAAGSTCPASASANLAWTPIYFGDASNSQSATGSFALIGSIHTGTRTSTLAGPPFTGPFIGTHYFKSPFVQSDYNNNSPYSVPVSSTLASSNDDIAAITINNTGQNTITELAIAFPPQFELQGYSSVDATLGGGTATACPTGYGSQWSCFTVSISSGNTGTLYLDLALTSTSFAYTDIQIQAEAHSEFFAVQPSSTSVTSTDGYHTMDSLAMGELSLIANDMGFSLGPSTVGQNSAPTLNASVTNTSTSVDPNPDSLDLIVLQAPNNLVATSGAPTSISNSWVYIGSVTDSSSKEQFWFGTCNNSQTSGSTWFPPGTNGVTTPLSSPYPTPGASCAPASEANALRPTGSGQTPFTASIPLTSAGFASTGTQMWTMYAHGSNSGAWSSGTKFNLSVTSESASVQFFKLNGTAVATSSMPTIGSSPNSYVYALTNTSNTSKISQFVVTLPGKDILGQNATDSSGNTWAATNITSGGVTLTAPNGQTDGTAGCTVNTAPASTFNPTTAGANGQITVNCTNLNPNDTIYVNFSAASPSTQSDTYAFPATVDGFAAGPAWTNADDIQIQFSIGVSITVNPANPGPGASTPLVSCATCAFAGSTIDYGNILSGNFVLGSDVVRASVIYTGANSPNSWSLYVSSNLNPTCTGGTCTGANEMTTQVDSSNSTTGAGVIYSVTSCCSVVPVGSTLQLATGPETLRTGSAPYDIIETFKINVGSEAPQATISTVTYTLIAN